MWTASAVTSGALMIEVAPQNRIAARSTGLAHDVVDALADLGQEPLAGPVDRGAQLAAHEQQPERRQGERRRVDGQRRRRVRSSWRGGRRSPDRRCSPSSRRPRNTSSRGPIRRPPDERRDRRGVARQEERAEHAHRCRDDQDHGHRRAAQVDRQRDQRGQDRPAEVGQEHHPLAIVAVGEGPRDHPEDQVRQRLERPDDAHRQPGARQGQDEQGQRREADSVPERRDALRGEEDLEVAVAGQRLQVRVALGHQFDGSGAVSCRERGMVEWRSSP